MTDLAALVATRRVAEDRFSGALTEGWLQGRTVFGGLTIGICVDAAIAWVADPEFPLRAASFALAAPTSPGAVNVAIRQIRRGSKTVVLGATLCQHDRVAASATLVFGQRRTDDCQWQQTKAPAPPAFTEVESLARNSEQAPEFAQHLEYRPTRGLPFSGAEGAVAEGWIGPTATTAGHSPATIALLTDIWWPAGYAMETKPRPIATIASTIQFYPETAVDHDAPVYHRGIAPIAQSGYVTEMRELWTESGSLLATNQQTFVWI